MKRWISLILILALLSGMPALAEAGEVSAEPCETEVFAAEGETGAEGLTVAPEDPDSSGGEAAEPVGEVPLPLEEDPSPTEEVPATPEISVVTSAYDDPAFIEGYVRALREIREIGGTEWGGALPEGAVLYAYDRSLEDRLAVYFDTPAGVVMGWVESDAICPLDDAEVAAYLEDAPADARCFDAEGTLPLQRIGVAEAQTAEAPVEQTAEEPPKSEENIPEEAEAPENAEASEEPEEPEDVAAKDEGGEAAAEDGEGEAEPPLAAPSYAIALNHEALELRVNQTAALSVARAAEDAGAVTWSVDDESVASVDEAGVVTALSVGTTRVLATAENGDQGACELTVLKIPESIRFRTTAMSLGLKEKSGALQLLLDDEGIPYKGAVRYTTSSKRYVKVSADGRIQGVKRGSAVIRATLPNGLVASCKVTVKKAPSKITAKPKSIVIGVGEKARVGWSLTKKSASAVSVTSANAAVATVDGAEVTGVAPGTAKLTLRTFNGKKATVTVTVRNAPESVAFAAGEIVLGVGQKSALQASVNAGAAGAITFRPAEDDPVIASVSGSTVQGRAVGETTVTATAYNGVSAVCKVVVKPAPTYVKLDYATLNLGVGNTWKLTPDVGEAASSFSFSSSRKKYVKVSANGTLKGLKKGSSTITIKTYNNKVFKLKVNVKKAPKKVTAAPASRNLGVGERFRLGYSLPSGTGGTVTFEPADKAQTVLDIDARTGDITALDVGEASVVIRTFNNKTAVCRVHVYPAPTSVTATPSSAAMGVGQTQKITAALSEGSWSALRYETSNGAVAAVSSAGVITAKGKGDAVITVRTYLPDVYAQIPVNVLNAPSSVTLPETAKTVNIGTDFQLSPVIPADSRTSFAYSTSNAKVATVDASGTVRAVARGTAKITVQTHNGKKAVLNLTVYDPYYPERIVLLESVPMLTRGGAAYQIQYQVIPETARESVRWTSAAPGTVKVDENGLLTPVGFGYSTITCTSTKNSAVKLSLVAAVETSDYTLTIPARTTGTGGISANRKKIDAIKQSALKEIARLKNGGVISATDANRRIQIVNNIFASYDFVWMTPQKQLYWKAANSEGGAKDFKPGIVYYGMPYISGSGLNRAYTAAAAISKGGYVSSGKGYYLLHKTNYSSRSYYGNDCSGLCDTAIWGMGNGAKSTYRTKDIAVKSEYKTIKDKSQMRPGDLLCKSGSHVVMFLYYANTEKTKIMIIENGGSEAGTNTVHCSVMNLSSYSKYTVRRLSTLG